MNSSVTVLRILEWVRLQIATNHKEDEPAQAEPDEAAAISPIGQTVALTVHKAKGLEYDYVLIPRTWAVINKQQTKGTVTSVQTINENKHRLIWRWLLDKHEYTNTTSQDAHLWDTEKKETIHEETRLLYVAMTRARHHLHIFRANPPAGDSWEKLLSMGESRNDN
jgi:DNA helicase-2/ATP-dependent DNA helicase PcrA